MKEVFDLLALRKPVVLGAFVQALIVVICHAGEVPRPFVNGFCYKDTRIRSGDYSLGNSDQNKLPEITISRDLKKPRAKPPVVTFARRANFSSGIFKVLPGCRISGNGNHFEDIQFEIHKDAVLRFQNSIFINCRFRHGGGHGKWAAEFEFENCVFDRGFFDKWSTNTVGLKMSKCSVLGATLPSFNYQIDVWAEYDDPWRTIEKCLFHQCRISESVLWPTEYCVFDECEFLDDGADYKQSQELRVNLRLKNTPREAYPSQENGKILYSFRDDFPEVGSKLAYTAQERAPAKIAAQPYDDRPKSDSELRSWMVGNQTARAKLVRTEGDEIILSFPNRQEPYKRPLAIFSDEDKQFVLDWKADRGLPLLTITENVAHLGNDHEPDFTEPKPLGRKKVYEFSLPEYASLNRKYYLHMKVRGMAPATPTPSFLVINEKNGGRTRLNNFLPPGTGQRNDIVRDVYIPIENLKTGSNTLSIEVTGKERELDDFEVHALKLLGGAPKRSPQN